MGFGLAVVGVWVLAVVAAATYSDSQQQSRASGWAEAVEACEKHGGVPVVRATRALGRSADLPACVPQLGD